MENLDSARIALEQGRPALVWRKIIADCDTPVGAAAKLIEPERGDFLLESVEGGEIRGRYSLLGLNPDLVFRARANQAEINRIYQQDRKAFQPCVGDMAEGTAGSANSDAGGNAGALAELRALSSACQVDVPEGLPPALAFLVGYFGYETIALVEDLPTAPPSPLDLPDMVFVRPTSLLVFDSLTDELFLIAPLWGGDEAPDRAIANANERIDQIERRLTQPIAAMPQADQHDDIAITPSIAAEDYEKMALRAKDYISAGDIFQVVLAQRFSCEFSLPPFALYRALRRINPSPFLYFLDLPGFAVVGSSPEILVRVRDEHVTIRPIAGTRPRGATPALDQAAEESLLSDPKERAEHLMLLDLGRNDVGRVASQGSVEVTSSFSVERYSHVMHIVSNVIGNLDDRHDALDALFAGFPAGTVSGAPKLRACEIIAELEPEARGAYAGGVGYFAPDGSLDSCIVLRTGVVKDGTLHVQAGAGIVADSDPAYEQRECEAKAGALFAAAREALRIANEPGFGQ